MIRVFGPWKEGYAFSMHSVRSECIGEDEFGHKVFNTIRTEMGELLYRLKYRQQEDTIEAIVEKLLSNDDFLRFFSSVSGIITIPSSNLWRRIQPVPAIASIIAAELSKTYHPYVLFSENREQVKNLDINDRESILNSSVRLNTTGLNPDASYVIFDDVYSSGSTLRTYTRILQQCGYRNISVFALTKTK